MNKYKEITKCVICGKEIEDYIRKSRRFCSKKCLGIWASDVENGGNNPNWKGGQNERVCEICGLKFNVPQSQLKRGYNRGRYCGMKCRAIAYKGIGNPRAKWIKELDDIKVNAMFDKWKGQGYSLREMTEIEGIPRSSIVRLLKGNPDYEFVAEMHCNKGRLYRIGAKFERRVRDYLKDKGYWLMRSPQSKSVVDLVAIKTGEILFVQCKVAKRSFGEDEKKSLVLLAHSVGAKPILAYRDGAKTQWAIQLVEVS